MPFIPDKKESSFVPDNTPSAGNSAPIVSGTGDAAGAASLNALEQYKQEHADYISQQSAALTGAEMGVMRLYSTLQKAATPLSAPILRKMGVPEEYINTPEASQAAFNDLSNDYEKATQQQPIAAFGGDLLGSIAATPVLGSATGVYKAAGGAGSLLKASNLLPALTSAGAMVTQGGLLAGLSNTKNNASDDILNEQAMPYGMAAGALAAGAEGMINNYAGKVANIKGVQDATTIKSGNQTIQYKGPIINSDYASTYAKKAADTLIEPWPIVGRMGTRQSQTEYSKQFISDYIASLSQWTAGKPMATIRKTIDKFNTQMQVDRKLMNASTYQTLDKQFGKIPVAPEVKAGMATLREDAPYLVKAGVVPEGNLITMTPSAMRDTKNAVYDQFQKLKNKGANRTPQEDLIMNKLLNTYHGLKQNIFNGVKSDPNAIKKLTELNAYESNYHVLMDKTRNMNNNAPFVEAVKHVGDNSLHVQKFADWIMGSTQTPEKVTQIQKLLGNKFTKSLESVKLEEIFNNSVNVDTGVFNVSQFLKSINDMKQGPQASVMKDTFSALQGLETAIMKPGLQAAHNRNISGIAHTVQNYAAGGIMVGAMGMGVTGAVAKAIIPLAVMSKISTSSPLKRILISIDRFANQPAAQEHFVGRALNMIKSMMKPVVNNTRSGLVGATLPTMNVLREKAKDDNSK